MTNLQAAKLRLLSGIVLLGLAGQFTLTGNAKAQTKVQTPNAFLPACEMDGMGSYGGFSNVGISATLMKADNVVKHYGSIFLPTWQLSGPWKDRTGLMDVKLMVQNTDLRPTRNSPRTVSDWKAIGIEIPLIKNNDGKIPSDLYAQPTLGDGSILPVIKVNQSGTTTNNRFVWHDDNEYFGKGGGKIGAYLKNPKGEITVIIRTVHPDQTSAAPELKFVFDPVSIAPAKKKIDSVFLPKLAKMEAKKKCEAKPGFEGCFLTTAACEGIGLADDCWELETLRRFRDSWLKNQPTGEGDIAEYYAKAPAMADDIRKHKSALVQAYWKWVLPSAILAQFGFNHQAYKHYMRGMRKLSRDYSNIE